MRVRRVRLRVRNVPWMTDYHGREARLVGTVVDAVELDDGDGGVLAYVDDRDGEASEYAEALDNLRVPSTGELLASKMTSRTLEELRDHARRRFLHGDVIGVRT
jgi:hypothetical protein